MGEHKPWWMQEMGETLNYVLRDPKDAADEIDRLRHALRVMVDRWEPDCEGQDRVMWENAVEALEFAGEKKGAARARHDP